MDKNNNQNYQSNMDSKFLLYIILKRLKNKANNPKHRLKIQNIIQTSEQIRRQLPLIGSVKRALLSLCGPSVLTMTCPPGLALAGPDVSKSRLFTRFRTCRV